MLLYVSCRRLSWVRSQVQQLLKRPFRKLRKERFRSSRRRLPLHVSCRRPSRLRSQGCRLPDIAVWQHCQTALTFKPTAAAAARQLPSAWKKQTAFPQTVSAPRPGDTAAATLRNTAGPRRRSRAIGRGLRSRATIYGGIAPGAVTPEAGMVSVQNRERRRF